MCPRSPCTPPPSNIGYRYILTERNHCPNLHIARSNFPKIRGLAACTCIARALCTATTQVMHHRMALVELYQCTKFHVASSKVPESEGAYVCAMFTCIAPHHETTGTIELPSFNSNSVPNLVSIAQSFLKPEDPSQINLSWRAQPASYKNGNHKNK